MEITLSELKQVLVTHWDREQCSTFILCMVSDLLDKLGDEEIPHFGFTLAHEIRELSYEACIPDE